MLDENPHLTLFQFKPPEEQIIDNYMIGHELETLVRKVLQKDFNVVCKPHFVTEPGPDAEFKNGAVEIINCKPYLTASETRFRRILHNLKQKRNKIVIASHARIFTKKQTTLLRKRGVHIVEVGTQIMPEYLWNRKSPEKRLGAMKSSRRNLKWVKNRILSQLLKIKELFLIYYTRKISVTKRNARNIMIYLCPFMKSALNKVNRMFARGHHYFGFNIFSSSLSLSIVSHIESITPSAASDLSFSSAT